MLVGRIDRAQRKLSETIQPLMEAGERPLAQLPAGMRTVAMRWELLIGPLAQLRSRQYAVVVTNRRFLLVHRGNLSGKRDLEAAYPRSSVTATFKKGWLYGGLILNLPDGQLLKLRIHPIWHDAARKIVTALSPRIGALPEP